MFYVYLIYSPSADRFYIGHSSNPWRRVDEHNQYGFNTYTSKFRPWNLKSIFSVESKSQAIRLEKFIKSQKSRRSIEKLVNPEFEPDGYLAQLVRVPHLRD